MWAVVLAVWMVVVVVVVVVTVLIMSVAMVTRAALMVVMFGAMIVVAIMMSPPVAGIAVEMALWHWISIISGSRSGIIVIVITRHPAIIAALDDVSAAMADVSGIS
ncbi:MAG: hypothetical protein Q7U57_05755 [Methylovulum sp.]|nr:hypothetical protein [Methylovulum sp.]